MYGWVTLPVIYHEAMILSAMITDTQEKLNTVILKIIENIMDDYHKTKFHIYVYCSYSLKFLRVKNFKDFCLALNL